VHNKELHNLHASLNIIRVIKSRRLGWVEHAAHMGVENVYIISQEIFSSMELVVLCYMVDIQHPFLYFY
jgi:hypothetical protein